MQGRRLMCNTYQRVMISTQVIQSKTWDSHHVSSPSPTYKGLTAAARRCTCSGFAYMKSRHMMLQDGCQIVMMWSQHRGSAPKDGVFIMYHHTA